MPKTWPIVIDGNTTGWWTWPIVFRRWLWEHTSCRVKKELLWKGTKKSIKRERKNKIPKRTSDFPDILAGWCTWKAKRILLRVYIRRTFQQAKNQALGAAEHLKTHDTRKRKLRSSDERGPILRDVFSSLSRAGFLLCTICVHCFARRVSQKNSTKNGEDVG